MAPARIPFLGGYRATGADLPWGDPCPYHGVSMEGYYWRLTDVARGRSLIALIGVNRSPEGPWATLGLAGYPNRFLRTVEWPEAAADPERLGASAGSAFSSGPDFVRVDLGPDARLELEIDDPVRWPRRSLGGSSIFQAVPALNQYWHPWLLGGTARGRAVLGGEEWVLDGASVYGEKNWGQGGFPPAWWWGQAQGFAEPSACVAFAGGVIEPGPFTTEVTARRPDARRKADPARRPAALPGPGRGERRAVAASGPQPPLAGRRRGHRAARRRPRAAGAAAVRAPQHRRCD